MLFYKIWHSFPLFLSQTMANQILRVPTNFRIPWRSAFFLFSFLLRLQWSDQLSCKINDKQMKHASRGVLNSIWKIANPTTTSSWAKIVSQNKKYLKVLKGSTWKFTWNGLKYHAYEFIVVSLEWLGFQELDAREVFTLSTGEGYQKTGKRQSREQ
jgi:hypothetical protein